MNGRREEILNIFENLAARFGLSRTTIKDIAREAGVSVGTIYNEFSDKEALIDAFWQRAVEHCIRRLDGLAAQDLPPEALLRQLILGHIKGYNEELRNNRGVYELMMESAISYIGKKVLGHRQVIQRELAGRVENVLLAGIRCGAFEVAGDTATTALRFVEAFTEYTAPPLVVAREAEDVIRDAASMFSFVVRALRRGARAGGNENTAGVC
ncbi:TetR/AcrR family transcriptional regulator [Anaeroselena agilis]|uniref:TetR/AcrR family transcriptional regulator n=1 Tax=Anaeroselena agilis TaxID=3063788 RepID=A0ABU3P299_9FIRM|nr:TetR/AcrR family transcriptional regulator [Selenomonadales bacterium 4137-cl]